MSVREGTWKTATGETKSAWIADFTDQPARHQTNKNLVAAA
jgi:hypothetical protein